MPVELYFVCVYVYVYVSLCVCVCVCVCVGLCVCARGSVDNKVCAGQQRSRQRTNRRRCALCRKGKVGGGGGGGVLGLTQSFG
jgi:hypothetical protein